MSVDGTSGAADDARVGSGGPAGSGVVIRPPGAGSALGPPAIGTVRPAGSIGRSDCPPDAAPRTTAVGVSCGRAEGAGDATLPSSSRMLPGCGGVPGNAGAFPASRPIMESSEPAVPAAAWGGAAGVACPPGTTRTSSICSNSGAAASITAGTAWSAAEATGATGAATPPSDAPTSGTPPPTASEFPCSGFPPVRDMATRPPVPVPCPVTRELNPRPGPVRAALEEPAASEDCVSRPGPGGGSMGAIKFVSIWKPA